MGVTKKFEIALSSATSVFFPGQCIEGHVLVELSEDMRMTGLSIMCTSKSEVHWKIGKHNHRGVEDYLHLKLTVFGNPSHDGDDVTLSAGKHAFPFKFILPVNLPGSYEGEPGCYVRHWLKAVMDRPWKFNKEYKMVFTVASVLDLNTIHNAAVPVQATASETSCCFGCSNDGTVTATFRIDKSGYVPGEQFSIHGEVHDGANVGINATCVKFVRRTVYFSATGMRKENTVQIGILRHEQVPPRGTDIWNGDKLRIPALAPSYLPGCNIILIQYFLKVIVFVGNSCSPNLKLSIPVIIGTVPLYATVQQHRERRQRRQRYQQDAASDTQPAITKQPQTSISPLPSAPAVGASAANAPVTLPPPSYQECSFGKVNTKDEGENYTAGNLNFAPSYTYYEDMV